MAKRIEKKTRHLVLVLGDQLDPNSPAFDDFDPAVDAVWMAEVSEEATHVWSHKARIVIFLSAMRHFRNLLLQRKITVHYRSLDHPKNQGNFGAELRDAIRRLKPKRLIVVEPGEWRVQQMLIRAAEETGMTLEIFPDRHFLCSRTMFKEYVSGRKQLRMEHFYRQMRRSTGIFMDGKEPLGGKWNLDAENRQTFGRKGPGDISLPSSFTPDTITREVIRLVEKHFPNHPGSLEHFDWPVTTKQATQAVEDFVNHRLGNFGPYQDAMWRGMAYLYHSRLSSSLNLKLLDPRDVISAAEKAYYDGHVPLNSAEGFIRQILGWREYVRGIYWHFMPHYIELNELHATSRLPWFYWTGQTEMNCLREVIEQTLQYGYCHHIQRLMVTGLFTLLLGVIPQEVHKWYLAVYVDAVEWVELPNTLGMSQFADGGIMASKPYVATGKYIQRMSNYCGPCKYEPSRGTGKDACPFTSLYWDFLMRHEPLLRRNPRMRLQLRNLERLSRGERVKMRRRAESLKHIATSYPN